MTIIKKSTPQRMLLPTIPHRATTGWLVAHVLNVLVTIILIVAAVGFEDAEKAMAFYGVYHREPWNQFIHFFGVPGIAWSMLVFQAHLPITRKIVIDFLPGTPAHYFNWATVLFLFYEIFYATIDPIGAILYTPFVYIMYMSAIQYVVVDQKKVKANSWVGTQVPLLVAFVVHFLSWYLQIQIGHQIIEGAQPASMQSLGGALTTAPLFAFYEGLWFLGVRKEFQARVVEQVAIYTKELCEQGSKMRVCSSI